MIWPAPKVTPPVEAGERAVPAGGPRNGGRGCAIGWALAIAALPLTAWADDRVTLPSGTVIAFHDHITDETAGVSRHHFRFVAPQIGQGAALADMAGDLAWLCSDHALPMLAGQDMVQAQIVIVLMEQPVAFGQATPGVTQFFEAFRVENGRCIWEYF